MRCTSSGFRPYIDTLTVCETLRYQVHTCSAAHVPLLQCMSSAGLRGCSLHPEGAGHCPTSCAASRLTQCLVVTSSPL